MVPHPANALGSSIMSSGVELYLSVVDFLPLKVPEALKPHAQKSAGNVHFLVFILLPLSHGELGPVYNMKPWHEICAKWDHVPNLQEQRRKQAIKLEGARQGFRAELMKIRAIVY